MDDTQARHLLKKTVPPHRRFISEGQQLITLYTILSTNIAKTSANNKEGKALTNSHGNPVSIDSIVPGGGRHSARLAKELREALDAGLGPAISRNFALGRAAPGRGAFAHVAGVTPQIVRNTASGQAGLAALLEGSDRELEGESGMSEDIMPVMMHKERSGRIVTE